MRNNLVVIISIWLTLISRIFNYNFFYSGRNILDDFREAYYWLWQNTAEDATVMSWWDYGYQIAGMANRTTLVDNNTWNNSHIALVGKAMSSNESRAYEIMTELNVDYVLVIFGGVMGYSGDDINKFLWMVRIAEGKWLVFNSSVSCLFTWLIPKHICWPFFCL